MISVLKKGPNNCRYYVVQPSRVEVPRSMASVAVAWNLPMHYWLKTCECLIDWNTPNETISSPNPPPLFMIFCYACHNMFRFSDVYKKSRSYGVFVAAFLTYAASSVLHVSDHDSLSLCELQLKFIAVLSSFSLKLWDLWFNIGRASWFIAIWATYHVGYNYCSGNVWRISLCVFNSTCWAAQHVHVIQHLHAQAHRGKNFKIAQK